MAMHDRKMTDDANDRSSKSKAPLQSELELPEGEDVVAAVSRDRDGNPAHSKNFVLLLPEDSTDADKAAAWNKGGDMPDEGHVRYYREG